MLDSAKRSPGLWIGLAAAVLATVACLGALAFFAILAGVRGGLTGNRSATPGAMVSVQPTLQPASTLPVSQAIPQLPANQWPLSNVPMPAETDLSTLVGPPEAFSVLTDQDFDAVLAFYQGEMETLGWTKVSYGTRVTGNDAELQYRNDVYHATVILARIPFIGTLVEIRLRLL